MWNVVSIPGMVWKMFFKWQLKHWLNPEITNDAILFKKKLFTNFDSISFLKMTLFIKTKTNMNIEI